MRERGRGRSNLREENVQNGRRLLEYSGKDGAGQNHGVGGTIPKVVVRNKHPPDGDFTCQQSSKLEVQLAS